MSVPRKWEKEAPTDFCLSTSLWPPYENGLVNRIGGTADERPEDHNHLVCRP